MAHYWNSTIKIKPGSRLKRSKIERSKPMKRSRFRRAPGTARTTLKSRPESPQMRRFKREVRERDNYTCQFPKCGYYSKHIDVHHIAKRSQRPDLKFESSNAVCLCREHHRWTDTHHDEAVRMGLLSIESYELASRNS